MTGRGAGSAAPLSPPNYSDKSKAVKIEKEESNESPKSV